MAIYYIELARAHEGSDVTGTSAIDPPFEGFNAGRNILEPGDTVYFHEGTYHNDSYGDGKGIHFQDDFAGDGTSTQNGWDQGQILIANNLVIRTGSVGIPGPETRGVINVEIYNNLISTPDLSLFAICTLSDVTMENAIFSNNIYSGGNGIRINDDIALHNGFTQVVDPSLC